MDRRLLATAIMSVSMVAQAQSFYKCTAPDGKITWQDRACNADSQPVSVQPANGSTRPVPLTNWSSEANKFANRQLIRRREAEVEAERLQSEHQAFVEKCRSMTEEAEREQVWESSVSPLVRKSSAVRVQQLKQRAQDMNCPY